MTGALGAEWIKLRRSSAAALPVLGLLAGLLQGSLFSISRQALHSWGALTAWHVFWTTALGPLALGLVAGLTARRERAACGGGVWWRPVAPRRRQIVEFAGLAMIALVTTGLVILSCVPFGLAAGLDQPVPWMRLIALALTYWAVSLPILALSQIVAQRLGLTAVLVLGVLGTVSGVLVAEDPLWLLHPWAWPVRATLTLTGTHANGLQLEASSPLWQASPMGPLALALVVTVLVVSVVPQGYLARVLGLPAGGIEASRRLAQRRPYVSGALASEFVKYRRSALPWLAGLAPVLCAGVGLIYAPRVAYQLWALAGLPLGAALFATAAWLWEDPAWRSLRTRPISGERLYLAKLGALWLLANASGLCVMTILGVLDGEAGFWFAAAGLHLALSAALLAGHLWLAARRGAFASLSLGLLATVLALVIGGSGLGATIWRFVPWVWGWTPAAFGRPLPFVLIAGSIGVALAVLGARDLARRENPAGA